MKRFAASVLFFAIAAAGMPARAVPYWIAYEGNDFPENEGWVRGFSAGGANRWIEDGALVIDSRNSSAIYDDYSWQSLPLPESGEYFLMQWRSMTQEQIGWFDTSITISRSGVPGDATALLGTDRIQLLNDWSEYSFESGVWHDFELRSTDMSHFVILVDGVAALEGMFQSPSILTPFVSFGDSWIGSASLSRWDYVRFGVVPEPQAAMVMAGGLLGAALRRGGRV